MPSGSKGKRPKAKAAEGAAVEPSSGNVFTDLGLPNPDLALAKAELVRHLGRLIGERRLTQAEAGKLLGLPQPKVSALLRGRVEGFTIDRLFRLLNALGQPVEIILPSEAGSHGKEAGRRILVKQ